VGLAGVEGAFYCDCAVKSVPRGVQRTMVRGTCAKNEIAEKLNYGF
jgi:hypothetical protein